MTKTYSGINIQWPISETILNGRKTIETRTYPLPQKYLNKELLLIETPGSEGKFKARIIAIIVFTDCFEYKNKNEFYKQKNLHLVTPDSKWAWSNKVKFGWKLKLVKKFNKPIKAPLRKGIKFTNNIQI
jgi:hypothetical protein